MGRNFCQGTETTAHNIIINETLAQVFSSEFCEMFKNTLLTEHLQTTAFKEMQLFQLTYKYYIK